MATALGRVAYLHFGAGLGGQFHGTGVDAVFYQHARRRVAALPGVVEAVAHATHDGGLKVGICEHNVRRLATELLGYALDGIRGVLRYLDAGARGAGERHHVHIGVGAEHIAHHGTRTEHHIEYARREAGFVDELRKQRRRQRTLLAGLQYHGATGDERRGHLGRNLVHGPVPRRDEHANTHRFTHDIASATRTGFPIQIKCRLDGGFDVPGAAFGLRVRREVERRAHFGGDGCDHFGVATFEHGQQAAHVRQSLLQRSGCIGGKSRLGCGYRGVGFGFATHVDERDHAFGGGVHHFEARALHGGCDPLAMDVMLECVHFGARTLKDFRWGRCRWPVFGLARCGGRTRSSGRWPRSRPA